MTSISDMLAKERKETTSVVWEPQPRQALMLSCPCFEVFYGGARGGGKTDSVVGDFAKHAQEFGIDAVGLVVRREYTQLKELLERCRQVYGPLGAEWNGKDQMWRFPNGARLTFAHLSNDADADTYQGGSYSRIYIEEAGNFPSPAPIFKLMACLRSANPKVHVGIRLTGNPGGVGHQWLKKRYIDPAPKGMRPLQEEFVNPFTGEIVTIERVFIPAKVTDNKFNNNAQYIARLQMVGNEKLVRAWLRGDWNLVIGAFFDNWDENVHVIEPFQLPSQWLRFQSGDWGSARPFAFQWFCVLGDNMPYRGKVLPRGALIMYREYYGSTGEPNVGMKLTVEQAANGIIALEADGEPHDLYGRSGINYRVLDPACFNNEGGATIAERFETKGLIYDPAYNKRTTESGRIGGWDMLRQRLDGEDGCPMIYFFSTCVDAIRTIPALQHDDKRPEDVDTDAEDHSGDACRYGCASRPWIKSPTEAQRPALSLANEQGQVIVDMERLWQETERKNRPSKSNAGRIA